jgi:3-methylfumaryl-CoA hydratase
VSGAEPTLADTGFAEAATDAMSRDRARQLAACLDVDPARFADGTVPPLWHWAYFTPEVPTSGLGADGHPCRRREMDAFPQRMWVGGRIRIDRRLDFDVGATRASRVRSTAMKEGAAGAFWLVTVEHTVSQHGEARVTEEQDLVFRGSTASTPPGPDSDEAPDAEWVEALVPHAVLLFRFSAVTNNAHRIHYDYPYATQVEGYPDLVVHGPLTALLLTEFAHSRTGADARHVAFRARAPIFANHRLWLTGHRDTAGTVHASAIRADHTEAVTLELG